MGAEPGHQEHRRPSTSVPTEASGWRSSVRRSIARLVPQPGQKTSSHGVPATSAARIVGDHSMSRPVARRRFQRSMTSSASRRATLSAFSLAAPALMSSPRFLIAAHPPEVDPAYGSGELQAHPLGVSPHGLAVRGHMNGLRNGRLGPHWESALERASLPFESLECRLGRVSASTDLALRLGVHHLPLLRQPIKLGSHRLIL
jgi:hypothetical protein